MSWYRTGTVTVVNGSPNVVGVGTLWLTQASVGDIFIGPDLAQYEVASITDDAHLAVKKLDGTAAYAGASLSAQAYAIIRNFTSTLPAQLAAQLAAMMTAWHTTTDDLANWLSGTGTATVHDAAGIAHTVQTPAALEASVAGRLSKSVAGSADVTLSSAEASNLILDFSGTLTGNINVIVPATARTYFIYNNTSGAYTLTVKTAGGTGIAVAQGGRAILVCDATNVVQAIVGDASIANGKLTVNATTGAAVLAGALTAERINAGLNAGMGAGPNLTAVGGGGTCSFICNDASGYLVTITSTPDNITAKSAVYYFRGMNKQTGQNVNPQIVVLGEINSPAWTFSYALSGTYNCTVTITTGADAIAVNIIPLGAM